MKVNSGQFKKIKVQDLRARNCVTTQGRVRQLCCFFTEIVINRSIL